jgi:hypothetical protein
MRPLNLVIEAIRQVAKRNEFESKLEFLTALRTIEGSCNVEDLNKNQFLWAETSGLIRKYLEPMDTEWKEKISELFNGQEDFTKYL